MDISKLIEKPMNRKEIITLSKPEDKIDEILLYIKKQINAGNQIFWVCPLIDESKNLNYSSAIKKFEYINKKFPQRVGLIHGSLNKFEKEHILNKFLNKELLNLQNLRYLCFSVHYCIVCIFFLLILLFL